MTIFNKSTNSDDTLNEFLTAVEQKFSNDKGEIDVEALKKGKAESDRFIEDLKREAAGMREDLQKRATYEELMAKIEANRPLSKSENNAPTETNETPDDNKSVDIAALVSKQVDEQLTLKQQQVLMQQNMQFVQQELTKTWGNNYVANLRERVQDLGLSEKAVNDLAATSPKALLEMLRPAAKATETSYIPPTSSRSVQRNTGTSDYDKFEKLRKENPSVYWSPKVQNELHKLAHQKKENLY